MTNNFQKDVIEASSQIPVVVDFWANWCQPCHLLGPLLEKSAAQSNGRWKLVKVDVEAYPEIAQQYQVRGIPAVKMFFGGKVIAEFTGALPEHELKRWLEGSLPAPSQKTVDQALEYLRAGNKLKAKKLLQESVDKDPSNSDALIILAKLTFQEDPDGAERLVQKIDESHPLFGDVDSIRTLQRLMATFKQYSDMAVKQNTETWRLYLKGIEALRNRQYDIALESWIEVVTLDRQLDDDGARKACVALFRLLGKEHTLTQKYHRQFTSALF